MECCRSDRNDLVELGLFFVVALAITVVQGEYDEQRQSEQEVFVRCEMPDRFRRIDGSFPTSEGEETQVGED